MECEDRDISEKVLGIDREEIWEIVKELEREKSS
jgi:hypothetical protein